MEATYKWPRGVQSITARFETGFRRPKTFATSRISSDFHINSNEFGMGLSHVAAHAQEVCWGEVCQGEASGTGAAGLVSECLL